MLSRLWLFAWGMLRHWWELMGCAGFTFLGVYAAQQEKKNGWLVGASFVVGVLFFIVAAYQVWAAEYNERLKIGGQLNDSSPILLGARLSLAGSRQGMFDLLVPILLRGHTAFGDDWSLDLTLGDGRKVPGLRGQIAEHAFNQPFGRYELTVSFPYGAMIPDLAALANATIDHFSAKDAQGRTLVLPLSPRTPLQSQQSELGHGDATPLTEREYQAFLETGSTGMAEASLRGVSFEELKAKAHGEASRLRNLQGEWGRELDRIGPDPETWIPIGRFKFGQTDGPTFSGEANQETKRRNDRFRDEVRQRFADKYKTLGYHNDAQAVRDEICRRIPDACSSLPATCLDQGNLFEPADLSRAADLLEQLSAQLP